METTDEISVFSIPEHIRGASQPAETPMPETAVESPSTPDTAANMTAETNTYNLEELRANMLGMGRDIIAARETEVVRHAA